MDWNNDGQENWEDEFLFENDMMGASNGDQSDQNYHSQMSIGTLGKILIWGSICYVGMFMSASIPLNYLTSFVFLLCVGFLFIRFLMWM